MNTSLVIQNIQFILIISPQLFLKMLKSYKKVLGTKLDLWKYLDEVPASWASQEGGSKLSGFAQLLQNQESDVSNVIVQWVFAHLQVYTP